MNKNSKIFVAGHRGLVGLSLIRELTNQGYENLLTRSHAELDLTNQANTLSFFEKEQPEYVFLAAAKVGGILANNTYPADFIYQNLMIQVNVINAAYLTGVKRLLFLGSSCIYPRNCPQPIKEEYLLTGPLEPTNRPYALAKIAGIEQCWSYNRQYGTRFLALMPTNLYGPGDNYDLYGSHVIPALIRKFHLAKLAMKGAWNDIERDAHIHGPIPDDVIQSLKEGGRRVILWGDGSPFREFMFSEDLAQACLFLMSFADETFDSILEPNKTNLEFQTQNYSPIPPLINVGVGHDQTICKLAEFVATMVGYQGAIEWDMSKPNGMPRKMLDVTRLHSLGWSARVGIEKGLSLSYEDYLKK